MLILYAEHIFDDYYIDDNERRNFEILKLYFGIKEGDFYKYKRQEVKNILTRQFDNIYIDGKISREEAMRKVDLQEMFDLSYNQFDRFRQDALSYLSVKYQRNINELNYMIHCN